MIILKVNVKGELVYEFANVSYPVRAYIKNDLIYFETKQKI